MALKVWLPLNGNINNNGLTENNAVINGSVPFSNGKLGKAADFTGASATNRITVPGLELNTLSVCAWFMIPQAVSAASCIINEGRDYNTLGWRMYITSANKISLNCANTAYNTLNCATNTWYHACITFGNGTVKYYINGELKLSVNTTALPDYSESNGYINIGAFGYSINNTFIYPFNGYINDVRIYDEVLSTKQIKEIAKGLCAHYKMVGTGANENLAIGTNAATTDINNFTLSLQTGGSTRTIELDETGTYCTKIVRNNVEWSGWKYMAHNNFNRTAIKTSTTYTVSLDVKSTVNSTMGLTGLVNGNATNYMTNSVTTVNGTINANQWNHLVFKCTTISDFSSITIGSQVIYFNPGNALLGTGVTTWVKNVKLEEGNIETNWIPNITDALYTTLGYNRMFTDDVSGYGNNATLNGTLVYNSNSPHYSGSTTFNSGYLHLIPSPLNSNSDAFTISCWFYPTQNSTQAIINDRTAVGEGLAVFYLSGGIRFDTGGNYLWQTSGSLTLNAWNHIVVTWDKKAGQKKYYLNGVLKDSTTNYGSLTSIGNVFSIGNSSTNGAAGAGNQMYGSLSDYRIYATALSANEVLKLYEISGIIDNKKHVYSYEFIEED